MDGNQHAAAAPALLFLGWHGFEKLQGIDYGRFSVYAEPVFGYISKLAMPPHILLAPVCIAAFMAGTMAPDLDSPLSKSRKWLNRTLDKMEHRTWLHTAYAVAAITLLSFIPQLCIWAALGYFTHLFLDSFSKCGVAWFRPKSGYRHFGNSKAKIKKGWHLVLYKNRTQAWILCSILWCLALFTAYLEKDALISHLAGLL